MFRPVMDYGIAAQKMSFGELKEIAANCGEIVLGIRLENGSIELNPAHNKIYILTGIE